MLQRFDEQRPIVFRGAFRSKMRLAIISPKHLHPRRLEEKRLLAGFHAQTHVQRIAWSAVVVGERDAAAEPSRATMSDSAAGDRLPISIDNGSESVSVNGFEASFDARVALFEFCERAFKKARHELKRFIQKTIPVRFREFLAQPEIARTWP